ncbi:PepSY-associated TM helix domain-containing protein [Rothia sp. P5764]|uniref:PepSY-associated TM helix domain-containing protein n=1 Tax=Rothia sp. P5764 TaxID=3402654 RepID=UPI003ACD360D
MNTTSAGTAVPSAASPRPSTSTWLYALLRRIHFYAGILVAPFIFIAAASGALYALAPQAEKMIYSHVLTAPESTTRLSLDEQVAAANAYQGSDKPVAVRPAVAPGTTTRIMYADESLPESTYRAVFIDPAKGQVLGDYPVYGSSGSLPFRTWVSNLHKDLQLGEPGRIYSELAASWLWVLALGGLVLWAQRARRMKNKRQAILPSSKGRGYLRTLSRHSALGFWLVLAMLFLSATGLTWSTYAGENVSQVRQALSWTTPSISKELQPGSSSARGGEHADHSSQTAQTQADSGAAAAVSYDKILSTARGINIDSASVEIRPAPDDHTAWVVRELKRSYPTQADSVAINGGTLEVTDRTDFEDFPLPAKLTSWGIALHMGLFLGIANQLALFLVALALMLMCAWGYIMWWQRRPKGERGLGPAPSRSSLRQVPLWAWGLTAVFTVALGLFIPLLGLSLLVFLLLDALLAVLAGKRGAEKAG